MLWVCFLVYSREAHEEFVSIGVATEVDVEIAEKALKLLETDSLCTHKVLENR